MSDEKAPSPSRQPAFFSAPEWTFILAACDRLIPADNIGPGALQAGVPEFIDRHMQTPYASGDIWYMQAKGPEAGRGAELYDDNCAACHRTDGAGSPRVLPKVAGNPSVLAADPGSLLTFIRTSWGNQASGVSAAEVGHVRGAPDAETLAKK